MREESPGSLFSCCPFCVATGDGAPLDAVHRMHMLKVREGDGGTWAQLESPTSGSAHGTCNRFLQDLLRECSGAHDVWLAHAPSNLCPGQNGRKPSETGQQPLLSSLMGMTWEGMLRL